AALACANAGLIRSGLTYGAPAIAHAPALSYAAAPAVSYAAAPARSHAAAPA
ncbi:unnamed protein product, partial [Allacma fusca]